MATPNPRILSRPRRRVTTDTGAASAGTIASATIVGTPIVDAPGGDTTVVDSPGVDSAIVDVSGVDAAVVGSSGVDAPIVDADDEEPETGPMRRCVVTRERLPKEQMFRFVIGPDRSLVPDLAGKLPGRGIWLSASRDVIEGGDGTRPNGMPRNGMSPGAKGRELIRAIARAARGPVQVPPDLPDVLETALIRRIGDLLGLARRAGQAIAGFEKARDWMRSHPVGLVLQASDGSEAERARFRSAVPDNVPVLDPLTGAELGRVMGHETVVHVALASGRLAGSIAREAGRLAGLRTPSSTRGTAGLSTGRETAAINDVTGTNG